MEEKGYYAPLEYTVSPDEEGILLKTIMQSRMGISRKLLSRLKQTEKGITLNGERVYINVKVKAGDHIALYMEEEESEDILPETLPLNILTEDHHLLLVNKPAGMIVHPTHGHYIHTLANAVVHHWREQGVRHRFRPVHRLDQETSGVLAIAKNPYAHQHISEQMKQGRVIKEYQALVYGRLQQARGTISAPIDRDPNDPHYRIVTPDGYEAITHYEVLEQFTGASLVKLRLETGRTHQIRVHMKSIGHPLFGDKMYGASNAEASDTKVFDAKTPDIKTPLTQLIHRQALHAWRLGFSHPASGEWMQVEADLPEDMVQAIELLRAE